MSVLYLFFGKKGRVAREKKKVTSYLVITGTELGTFITHTLMPVNSYLQDNIHILSSHSA